MDRKYVFYCCKNYTVGNNNCPEKYCIASVDLSVRMFAPHLYATGLYLYNLNGSKHEYWDTLNYSRAIYIEANSYIFDSLDEAVAFAASKYTPCPDQGSFYGYKKANLCIRSSSGYIREEGECIITLHIPEEAARTGCYYERKCRAESAEVVKIEWICGKNSLKEVDENYFGFSAYYSRGLRYEVGQTVSAGFFDPNKEIACASGIHFFLKKEEAIAFL